MKLWQGLPERRARRATWLAFLAVAVVWVPLGRVAPPCGYLALEFPAFHLAHVADPASWASSAREDAFFGLGLDFLFLVLYPLWLSLACFLAATRRGLTTRLGAVAAAASTWVWSAAPLDAAENAGLYFWLAGHHDPGLGLAISLVAGAKWLVALGAAGVALVVTAANLSTRHLSTASPRPPRT